VVELALAVADRYEFTAELRRNLEFGALLHDVGKIAIPKEIINKPGKPDPGEWAIIKPTRSKTKRCSTGRGGPARGRPDRPLTPQTLGRCELP
jgi:hypothetical protein